MIDLIVQMLRMSEHYGESKLIDIAKGQNKLPLTIKEKAEQIKRDKAWQ